MSLGLVLGGGGVAGIAWELGVILGLADAGVSVLGADRVVGTSAGSVVGVQISSGVPIEELFAAQLAATTGEKSVDFDIDKLVEMLATLQAEDLDPTEALRRVGTAALAAETVTEAERMRIIESRLPSPDWPDRDLIITGVHAMTGEFCTWTRESGVRLADAVAASCAVPGVWPPATVGGRRYIDGGIASPTNASLARGCSEVLVIAPMVDRTVGPGLEAELAELGQTARSAVIVPDERSQEAFGTNPLDPATRIPAAKAGRAQGRVEAFRVGIGLSL